MDTFLPMGPWGLFVLAFAESSFFPVPPDILLIALALLKPETSFALALITTIGSVLGAMFGYGIGLKGGRPLLNKLVSEEKIALVSDYFNKYDVWAIGIAGFTPIPYKVFTISAGVFSIHFVRFVIVSILARGARFFLVGGTIYLFGPAIRPYIDKYFNLFSLIIVLLVVGGFLAVHYMARRHKRKPTP
jgi:membrane protein YqaA with SNARE-associated domain